MKQIKRTPVPVPGTKTTPKPKATPSRTPVPLPGAKATSKLTVTPSRTPVPIPGVTAARKVTDTPSKTPLSQEFIATDDDDSSSDSDSSADDASQRKKVEKSKITTGVHKPNGVVKTTPKSNKKDNAARKTSSTPLVSVRKPSVTPVPVPVPISGLKRKADGSASDGSSSDTSDTSDSFSDESGAKQVPQQTSQQVLPPSQLSAHTVAFVPTQPYVPPQGFAPVPINDTTTSKVGSIFDNLGGKQVWHITAPAGVSLADLQELTMEDLVDGKTVLNDKDVEYRLSMTDKSEDGPLEVVIPRQHGYKAVPARISRTLHVQAITQIPALSSRQADQNTVPKAAASITQSTIRAPRPQAKRLKMRFLPVGFVGDVAGTLGDSESENESLQRTEVSETPNELRLPLRTERQTHNHVNGVEAVDLTSTKSKKHRTPEEIKRREERRAKKEKRRAQEAARAQP